MAKSKLTTLLGNSFEVWDAYTGDIAPFKVEAKQAVYLDYNYSSVIFIGKGLKGPGDYMTKGEITAIDFDNYQGKHFLTVTDLDLKATKVSHILIDDGVEALMTYIFRGNDTIKGATTNDILKGGAGNDRISGGAGGDHLYGGAGNDTLTGGAGTDYFELEVGGGKDKVTDFVGGLGEGHDYVHIGYGLAYDVLDNSNGAIVKLSTGETIQLLGVDADQVQVFQDYVDPNGF